MPIPTPDGGEGESEFIGRCMSEISGEYDQDQALAICYSSWERAGKGATMTHPVYVDAETWKGLSKEAKAQTPVVKGYQATIRALKEGPDDVASGDPVYEFTITTGSVDRDGDTVDPAGWHLGNYLKNPTVLWAHDYKMLPVGVAIGIESTAEGLKSRMKFPPAGINPHADMVHEYVKLGFLNATSVGFKPIKAMPSSRPGTGVDFKEQELMEFSIVPVPANPQALITLRAASVGSAQMKQYAETTLEWAKAFLDRAQEIAEDEKSLATTDAPATTPLVSAASTAQADPPHDREHCPNPKECPAHAPEKTPAQQAAERAQKADVMECAAGANCGYSKDSPCTRNDECPLGLGPKHLMEPEMRMAEFMAEIKALRHDVQEVRTLVARQAPVQIVELQESKASAHGGGVMIDGYEIVDEEVSPILMVDGVPLSRQDLADVGIAMRDGLRESIKATIHTEVRRAYTALSGRLD